MACDQKAVNIGTSRVIPVILFGIIGYASWALTKRLCIEYLINPPDDALVPPRVGSAIAILVIYYFLLILVLICYARLILTIITNPGFVPYGSQWYAQNPKGGRSKSRHTKRHKQTNNEKSSHDDSSGNSGNENLELGNGGDDSSTIEFWQRDIFVCKYDGRPAYCSTCFNFKPDRGHHCSEVQRCVQKMDHFCPWVGGIVSETSLKYFVQFTAYTALYTLHTLVSMAVFVAEQRHKTGGLDVHKVLTLAFAALFLLFSSGMTLSTVQMTMIGVTTVENLSRRSKIWYLAVLIPRPELGPPNGEPPKFMTITYPRPPEEELILQQHGGNVPDAPESNPSIQRIPSQRATAHYHQPRTFAILATKPGENPFDLGPLENMKQVMGYNYLDWVLPIKPSPCSDHSSRTSSFKMNDTVRRLQVEVGLLPPESRPSSTRDGHHRRSSRTSTAHRSENTSEKSRTHEHHHRRHRHRRRRTSGSGVIA